MMRTVSETLLLLVSITVSILPAFVTSEQTCVTPRTPCDWPNCPRGDPGWRHEDVKFTINRGDVEDSLMLDWANTVLYPNLVKGIFVGSKYYGRPQNPLKHIVKGPICQRDRLDIKLAYNVRDDRGIDLCYKSEITIDPHPSEYFAQDKEVPMKKVELSEDTYRVEWLEGMFIPRRYESCVTSGFDGQQFMVPEERVYFTKIPFCGKTKLDYKFFRNSRHMITKILWAECDRPQPERETVDVGGGMGSSGTGVDGTVRNIGILVIVLTVFGALVGGGLYVKQKWKLF